MGSNRCSVACQASVMAVSSVIVVGSTCTGCPRARFRREMSLSGRNRLQRASRWSSRSTALCHHAGSARSPTATSCNSLAMTRPRCSVTATGGRHGSRSGSRSGAEQSARAGRGDRREPRDGPSASPAPGRRRRGCRGGMVVGAVAAGAAASVGGGRGRRRGADGVVAGGVSAAASLATALATPIVATRPSIVETPRPAAVIRAPLAGWRRRTSGVAVGISVVGRRGAAAEPSEAEASGERGAGRSQSSSSAPSCSSSSYRRRRVVVVVVFVDRRRSRRRHRRRSDRRRTWPSPAAVVAHGLWRAVAAAGGPITVVGSVTSTTTAPSSPSDAVNTIVRSPLTKSTGSDRGSLCDSAETHPGSATTWSRAMPLRVASTHTVPVSAMSYCWAAPAGSGGRCRRRGRCLDARNGDVGASAPAGGSSSSVAASSPIALLSAALRMPMLAATAAVPARSTPAMARRSSVRCGSSTIAWTVPSGGINWWCRGHVIDGTHT